MKLIKTLIFLFLLTFTTHAFAKSNDYYQMVITNVLTNCKSDECRKAIFEQEVHIERGYAFGMKGQPPKLVCRGKLGADVAVADARREARIRRAV